MLLLRFQGLAGSMVLSMLVFQSSPLVAGDWIAKSHEFSGEASYTDWLLDELAGQKTAQAEIDALLIDMNQNLRDLELLAEKDPIWYLQLAKIDFEQMKQMVTTEENRATGLRSFVRRLRNTKTEIPRIYLSNLKQTMLSLAAKIEHRESDLSEQINRQLVVLGHYVYQVENIKAPSFSALELQTVMEAYTWLSRYGLSQEFLSDFHRRYHQSNLSITFNKSIFSKLITALEPEFPDMPVSAVTSDQTRVTGTAKVNGTIDAFPVSSKRSADLRVTFLGSVDAKTVSQRKKVSARSRSHSEVSVEQGINLDGLNVSFGAPKIKVWSNIAFGGFDVAWRLSLLDRMNFGSNLVRRVANRKKTEIEAESSSLLRSNIEQGVREKLADVRKTFDELLERFIYSTLARQDLQLDTHAESDVDGLRLHFGLTEYRSINLSGSSGFAEDSSDDFSFMVHESLLNAVALLCDGQEVLETNFRELLFNKIGAQVSDEEAQELVGITPAILLFDSQDSLKIKIVEEENQIRFQLRLKEFEAEGMRYTDRTFRVSAGYEVKIESNTHQLILKRAGDIDLGAENEDGQVDENSSKGEDVDALSAVISRFFPSLLKTNPIALSVGEKAIGILNIQSSEILQNGWLRGSWNIESKE